MPLTLELTVHVRARPAPGALLGRVETRHLRDGYHEEDLDLWDSEGTGLTVAAARPIGPTRAEGYHHMSDELTV